MTFWSSEIVDIQHSPSIEMGTSLATPGFYSHFFFGQLEQGASLPTESICFYSRVSQLVENMVPMGIRTSVNEAHNLVRITARTKRL